jgi:hypothetical protein
MRNLKSAAVIAALFFFAACGGGAGAIGCRSGGVTATPSGRPRIVLNASSPRPTIDVVDVPADQLALIAGADTREAWTAILKVAVAADQPAAVGQYSIENDVVRFTPMFPLDNGRQYQVTFTAPGAAPITATVGLPPPDTTPTTSVAEVYPTGDTIPENQLRIYIYFSAPMGSRGALDFVHLLDDESGQEVKDPFLPLDVEFWNEDRTRYTVFFDPGRQKRGIPPLDQMGRSLTAGKTYTLVIDAAWLDGKGLPLMRAFKRTFTVGPPDEKPLDPKTWKVEAPPADSSAPLVVAFPEPLDHGLLLRGLGVLNGGKPLDGKVVVSNHELTWSFTPAEAWKAGTYNLVAFAMLEDLAGNRIGRAFEVDQFDRTDQSNEPEKTLIPFSVH